MAVYKISASKANLMRAKETLQRLESGYELLDKKRIVLQRESQGLIKRSQELRKEINIILADYYKAMDHAFISLGSSRIRSVAGRVPIDNSLDIIERSLMGIPIAEIKNTGKKPDTGYLAGDMALDQAGEALDHFRKLLPELAALENSVKRLEKEIDKTQKRANALEKVRIPAFKKIVSDIESILEEKEREEFFRLKLVKKGHQKKSES